MDDGLKHRCPHCSATDARRLGECSVCRHAVCERCGNVQFASGERRVVHDECVKHDADAFRMIRFVR